MEIKVGKYIIRSDAYCYWIDEEYEGKTKAGVPKTYTRNVTGYFRKIEQLADDLAEAKLRSSDAKSLKEITRELSNLRKETTAGFKKYFKELEDGK